MDLNNLFFFFLNKDSGDLKITYNCRWAKNSSCDLILLKKKNSNFRLTVCNLSRQIQQSWKLNNWKSKCQFFRTKDKKKSRNLIKNPTHHLHHKAEKSALNQKYKSVPQEARNFQANPNTAKFFLNNLKNKSESKFHDKNNF